MIRSVSSGLEHFTHGIIYTVDYGFKEFLKKIESPTIGLQYEYFIPFRIYVDPSQAVNIFSSVLGQLLDVAYCIVAKRVRNVVNAAFRFIGYDVFSNFSTKTSQAKTFDG